LGVRQDAVDNLRTQGCASHGGEQLTSFGLRQAIHRDRRKLFEDRLYVRVAHSDDQADAVRAEPAGNEAEHLRRFRVKPVRVVDNAQQRLGFTRLGEQGQCRQCHQEPLRRRSGLLAKGNPERGQLRRRQFLQLWQAWDQQLVQATEGQAEL